MKIGSLYLRRVRGLAGRNSPSTTGVNGMGRSPEPRAAASHSAATSLEAGTRRRHCGIVSSDPVCHQTIAQPALLFKIPQFLSRYRGIAQVREKIFFLKV